MDNTVLALDYGEVRIGVAVSDASRTYALAHGVVPAQPEDKAIAAIRHIAQEERASHIVVGMPLTLRGEKGAQANKTEAFVSVIRSEIGLPVETVDERFSTADAKRYAKQKGTPVDAEAARLVLETWLGKPPLTIK